MKLRLGKMSTQEIAEWFGVSYSTYRKSAKKRLEELKKYCDYQRVYGGVIINHIFIESYMKEQKAFEVVREETKELWVRKEPESCKRVAARILAKGDIALAQSTCEDYVRIVRDEFWGKPNGKGTLGSSKYVWVKMYRGDTPANNRYEFISEEEKEIYCKIHMKYYGDEAQKSDIAKEQIINNEWTKAEAWDFVHDSEKAMFQTYIAELANELGCDWMVKATYVEDGQFFEIAMKDIESSFGKVSRKKRGSIQKKE